MVAAVCGWHEFHASAAAEIERRLAAGQSMIVAGPALVEAYAVLTGLPAPYRLAPTDAHALMAANFLQGTDLAVLESDGYWSVVDAAPNQGVAGGQIYDSIIAACARRANADALLTFNARHFRAFESDFDVVVPRASSP
jgi:predicted nucleic acid-binding protein